MTNISILQNRLEITQKDDKLCKTLITWTCQSYTRTFCDNSFDHRRRTQHCVLCRWIVGLKLLRQCYWARVTRYVRRHAWAEGAGRGSHTWEYGVMPLIGEQSERDEPEKQGGRGMFVT